MSQGLRPLEKPESRAGDEDRTLYTYGTNDDDIISLEEEGHIPWEELSAKKKLQFVLFMGLKIMTIFVLMYFFICSLDLLSVGFRILGGPKPQTLLRPDILNNHVVGLMCGVLLTILVQSSSTTSSAVVGMVAQKIIPIRAAIPIIMGANIGTSVTNTLLSMVQVADRDKFRRAFAAATVHDMFNWLTTLVLLPFESLTGYLYHTTYFLVREISIEGNSKRKKLKLLKALTDPLTTKIVKIDKKVTEQWTHDNTNATKQSVVENSGHIFAGSGWSDRAIGATVTVLSFVILISCLFLVVKVLKSILKGKIAVWIRRMSNAKLPHCPSLTDYVLMLVGALLTFLVQSSSAFTSTLPPLVAVRALSLERAYGLTLGANIGTTTTALLAALSQSDSNDQFRNALQIALCHLLFNVTGVLLFYPMTCTRFPIRMAKTLGNTTAHYRWFAIVYVVVLFILLPLMFMGLAFAGSIYVIIVATSLVLTFLFVVCINSLRKYPRFLPRFFHTWNWLPMWMRSLAPYDNMFVKCSCCHRLVNLAKLKTTESHEVAEKPECIADEVPQSVKVDPSNGVKVDSAVNL